MVNGQERRSGFVTATKLIKRNAGVTKLNIEAFGV
jgi:hypothetical protein